jgi:hypothetical protein
MLRPSAAAPPIGSIGSLEGGNRGEIPGFQPKKFELVNLKAGKAPGLKMPLELLAVAEEVIK